MIVLSAIKLHCKSGIVVNLNIYACLGKVIVRQTPFAVKHQNPGSDLFRKRKKCIQYIQKTGQKISTKCQQSRINHDFMLNESYYIFPHSAIMPPGFISERDDISESGTEGHFTRERKTGGVDRQTALVLNSFC